MAQQLGLEGGDARVANSHLRDLRKFLKSKAKREEYTGPRIVSYPANPEELKGMLGEELYMQWHETAYASEAPLGDSCVSPMAPMIPLRTTNRALQAGHRGACTGDDRGGAGDGSDADASSVHAGLAATAISRARAARPSDPQEPVCWPICFDGAAIPSSTKPASTKPARFATSGAPACSDPFAASAIYVGAGASRGLQQCPEEQRAE